MRGRTSERWRRRFGQRGAVVVEAALIMPVVILISMGVVDLGFLVDHNLTLASATTAGTRAGVRAGNSPDADQQVLEAIASAEAKLKPNSIEQIIIFRADDADGSVPEECFDGSDVAKACNTYGPEAMTTFVAETAWPPANRRAGAFGDADYLGVHVVTNHEFTIGMFGDSRAVSDTVVMLIDPTGVAGASAEIPPPPSVTTSTTTTTTTTTTLPGPTTTTTSTIPPPTTSSTTTTTVYVPPAPTTTTTTVYVPPTIPPPTTSTSTTSTTWPTPPTTGTNS